MCGPAREGVDAERMRPMECKRAQPVCTVRRLPRSLCAGAAYVRSCKRGCDCAGACGTRAHACTGQEHQNGSLTSVAPCVLAAWLMEGGRGKAPPHLNSQRWEGGRPRQWRLAAAAAPLLQAPTREVRKRPTQTQKFRVVKMAQALLAPGGWDEQ